MGGAVGIFSTLLRGYILSAVILLVVVVSVIRLNRMQSLYQHSLVRKVNKIKDRQKEYINEKDESKLPKLEKKHAKAVKRLERRIKRVLRYNRNVVITNNALVDEANLALPSQPDFTFVSKLDELISVFNKKTKRSRTINATKKGKAISAEQVREEIIEEVKEDNLEQTENNVIVRSLTEEESQEFEDVHQITFDELVDSDEVKKSTPSISNSNKDIYKDQNDDMFGL